MTRIIVAPRLPKRPANHTGNPFNTEGDLVANCAVEGCGYHAMGPRADVKKAFSEHIRIYHSETGGVMFLNQPQQ